MKPERNIRRRYNYDADAVSIETGIVIPDTEEDNRTKQEFADEVDINTLLKRFNITGKLPEGIRMPTYGDFSEVYDFHTAANALAQANEAFEQMPAEVRLRFQNDPAKFVAFCDDENNRPEAERLGLVDPRPPKPQETPEKASTGTVPPAPPQQAETKDGVS